MTQVKKSVSIVIPAYNEGLRLRETCGSVCGYFDELDYDYELIVVDDGSRDDSVCILKDLSASNERIKYLSGAVNQGKGRSVRTGIMNSEKEYVLFTDADLSTPISEAVKLLDAAENGCCIAIGSRALPGSNVVKRQAFWREYSGKVFNRMARCILPLDIMDTQCGFKLFQREAARKVFSKQTINGFAFDLEILWIAKRMGYPVSEVPVIWKNSPKTSVNLIKEPAAMFLDLLKIKANDLKGVYS